MDGSTFKEFSEAFVFLRLQSKVEFEVDRIRMVNKTVESDSCFKLRDWMNVTFKYYIQR